MRRDGGGGGMGNWDSMGRFGKGMNGGVRGGEGRGGEGKARQGEGG